MSKDSRMGVSVIRQTKNALLAGAAVIALSAGAAQAAPPASAWSSLYFGVNGGFGSGDGGVDVRANYFPSSIGGVDGSGGVAGAQVGFDHQFGGVVLGGVADIDWMSINGDRFFGGKPGWGGHLSPFAGKGDQHISKNYDWMATFRGRVGVPMGNFLPFVTAGVAVASFDNSYKNITYPQLSGSQSGTHVGLVIGAGAEAMISQMVSVQAQFLHTDFGSQTMTIPDASRVWRDHDVQ